MIKYFLGPAVTVLILLGSACTSLSSTPKINELDWKPEQILKYGCPDLTGRYLVRAPGQNRYKYAFPRFTRELSLYKTEEARQAGRRRDVVVDIGSYADGVYIAASNEINNVHDYSRYDGVMIGCSQNMLVARYIGGRGGGGETGGCSSFSYGENHLYVNGNGDLVVKVYQRIRCATFGALRDLQPRETTVADHIFKRISN